MSSSYYQNQPANLSIYIYIYTYVYTYLHTYIDNYITCVTADYSLDDRIVHWVSRKISSAMFINTPQLCSFCSGGWLPKTPWKAQDGSMCRMTASAPFQTEELPNKTRTICWLKLQYGPRSKSCAVFSGYHRFASLLCGGSCHGPAIGTARCISQQRRRAGVS